MIPITVNIILIYVNIHSNWLRFHLTQPWLTIAIDSSTRGILLSQNSQWLGAGWNVRSVRRTETDFGTWWNVRFSMKFIRISWGFNGIFYGFYGIQWGFNGIEWWFSIATLNWRSKLSEGVTEMAYSQAIEHGLLQISSFSSLLFPANNTSM